MINKATNINPGKVKNPKLLFRYLPDYALFLINNKLEEYVKKQIQYSREEEIPLLKFLVNFSEDELLDLGMKSSRELLTSFAENTIEEYTEKSSIEYIRNQIPFLEREQIVSEDIPIISLIRRKTLRIFLNEYTVDMNLFIHIMEEVDRFIAYSEAKSFNAYLQIQQEKISQINKQLNEGQAELLEAQRLADMGSFYWDLKEGKSEFTPGVMKIFQLEKNSNLESFLNDVHEDDQNKVKEALDRSFKGDGVYECEYSFVKNNIHKRIWSRGLVNFEDGRPVSMTGTIMDISEKYKMVKQLQESENLHKQAQALTHIGNWSWDVTSDEILWSDEMFRIYGLEPQSEKITFDKFISLIHPDDRDNRIAEIQEALATRNAKDYVLRIINPDGKVKVLQGKGEVITDNKNIPVKVVGTCQDITREHYLNNELLEKEKYLNQLINNAPDSVIVINDRSEIQLWNPKTEQIFGWKSQEVLGKDLSEVIIPKHYREAHKAGMKRLLETGEAKILNKTLELSALNNEGKEFYVSITISKSVQHGQQHFIAFLRDITAEKNIKAEVQVKNSQLIRLNASLEFKNSELERINKELESFNYVASHDLQEPLRKIQTFASRIIDKDKNVLPPDTFEYFDKIIKSSARMQLLIEDLLTFSQTTTTNNNFQKTDLNIVFEDAKNILSAIIEEKKAIINADSFPVIVGLPFQLQQLFLNLIGNALKYSHDSIKPIINITSDIINGNALEIPGAIPENKYLKLQVADNGIGFEMHNSEKIFELFQRLHHKNKYSGTGIGLAICKKIVTNHNGFIKAESIPKKGSIFTVYLPLEIFPKDFSLVN